jgi:ElaB/YqjD/DUF883 family membrane-anchored ribosome-binding protein
MTSVTAARSHHGRSSRRNGAADPMRATREARAALAKDFQTLISDAEELMHVTADSVGEQAAAARVRMQKSLSQVRDRLSDDMESLTERGREAVSAADDYVHRRPWQVIGVTAVAAAVAGFFFSRR